MKLVNIMKKEFEDIRHIRSSVQDLIADLTVDQLNKIPEGFNNNIIWNVAHSIAVQQSLCYVRSGLNVLVEPSFYEAYKSGTKPERALNEKEMEAIRKLMFTTIDQLESDYRRKKFIHYSPVAPFGVEINNIDEALSFLLFHEGFHLSYIMALKRA